MANWATTQRLGDPSTPEWKQKFLRDIEPVPGQRFTVFGDAAPAFTGLVKDLAATGYKVQSSGGYNYRPIRGSETLSQHAFGTAIDINAFDNLMGGAKSNLPPNVGEIARRYGLEWGGNWKNRPDPMHFEYTGGQSNAQPGMMAGSPQATPANASLTSLEALPSQEALPQPGTGLIGQLTNRQQSEEDWLHNTSYSADAILSDMFAGKSPLKRYVFQKAANIFGALI